MSEPLRPWGYDGMMNADHFSGELRFTRNGSGLNIDFRSGGREWRVWVNGRQILELLAGGEHGAKRVVGAEGYAMTGLGLLEPDAPRDYWRGWPTCGAQPEASTASEEAHRLDAALARLEERAS